MNLLNTFKSSKVIAFLLLSLLSTPAFSDQNCSIRSSNGSASQLGKIGKMIKATWYSDRDNSMTKLSTDEGVGAAMVVIDSFSGYTQGIQVCPGVYLATAHGALDWPSRAKRDGRDVREPNDHMKFIDPYPMSDDNFQKITDAKYIYSKDWEKSAKKDYVFITIDEPMKPKNFVRPLMMTDSEFRKATREGLIDFRLHRQPSLYPSLPDGRPDLEQDELDISFDRVQELYDAPLRVNGPCKLDSHPRAKIFGTSCPVENGVSGSSLITTINGEDFVVGIITKGNAEIHQEKFDPLKDGNGFVQSNLFCKDYEKACGEPCPELKNVLERKLLNESI